VSDRFFRHAQGGDFKALNPRNSTPIYRQYLKEEAKELAERLHSVGQLLEAGVGIGRTIPLIAPHVDSLTGVDQSDGMLAQARIVAAGHPNVQIVKSRLEDLDQRFAAGQFDHSVCLWNTIGNVKSDLEVLRKLGKVTRSGIILTVHAKGNVEKRKEYYEAIGAPVKRVDADETVYTTNGLVSRAYSKEDLHRLARSAGLSVAEIKTLAGVMWLAVMKKETGHV